MTDITILDGGMGQELVARSTRKLTSLWATKILLQEPELVQSVHDEYFAAGAQVATTNSYATHRDRLQPYDAEEHFERLLISAGEIANRARDKHGSGLIAGGTGPSVKSYRPDLALNVDQGAEVYAEIATILSPFVDVILLETMASVEQAKGALIGAKAQRKPVWLSVTVSDDDGSKLRSGEAVTDVIEVAKQHGADALLVNCSIPEAVSTAMRLLNGNDLTVGAYANGFTRITDDFKEVDATVDQLETRKDLNPDAYLSFAQKWSENGTEIIGGCCEVGPGHISRLASTFK